MSVLEVRTIAFEGLDGSGKGTSIRRLSELIDCECWETPEQPRRDRRREISEQSGETDELYQYMVQS